MELAKTQAGVICIEGPDGVGKTTLAEHFEKEYDALKLHATYRFKKMIPSYHEALRRRAEFWAEDGNLVILDRHWITEAIYASVFRGGTAWPEYTHAMDVKFRNMRVLTIMCLPRTIDESLVRRYERDRKDPENLEREKPVNAGKAYSDEQMVKLYTRYLDLWKGSLFYHDADRVSELTREGGVWGRPDFMRYRIEEEGQDVDSFAWNAIQQLRRVQQLPEGEV